MLWRLLCTFAAAHSLVVPSAPTRPVYSLHDVAAAGDAGAVDLLLRAGLPSAARNAKASTPLHIAALHGHEDVAEILLEHGSPVDCMNDDGCTPLHAAVLRRQLHVAQLLLSSGAEAEVVSNAGLRPLDIAARQGDARMLSALLEAGAELDEETAEVAFSAAVAAAESSATEGGTLSPEVPRLLRHVFDADMLHLMHRGRSTTNVTCMQPAVDAGTSDELASIPLRPGRRCDGGCCCDACSRVAFPSFATPADLAMFPLRPFSLQKCAFAEPRTILSFVRLVERMRRAIAYEYGLPLSGVLPLQTSVSNRQTRTTLHCDEDVRAQYHYSAVLYLTTHGEDFEGGEFVWNDPAEDGQGRVRSPGLTVTSGSAIVFSSGWENLHEVPPLVSGNRLAMPSFFTTCPAPEEMLAAVPTDDEGIAAELQRLLLASCGSAADVGELMMKWDGLLAGPRVPTSILTPC